MENKRSADPAFLKKAVVAVMANLEQEHFSGNELAEKLSLSREQTHRKIKQLTSLSTGKFIRNIRVLKAYDLLVENNLSIAEVSYKVGFGDPSYFNKCFREEIGISPGEVKKTGSAVPLANGSIFSFYQIPEVNELLRLHAESMDPPERKDPALQKKWWIPAGLFLLLAGVFIILYYQKWLPKKIDPGKNNRIAVLPFTNQTGDSILNGIGDITSSWISNQLAQIKTIQTVPYFTVKQYQSYIGVLPGDPEKRPPFRDLVAARYFITGDYYLKNDRFYFNTHFVDAYTLEPVYDLPVMNAAKDSVMILIEEIRLKIAGLVTNLENVKQGKLKPPNYEAYSAYLEGLEELNTGLYENEAVYYFEKASTLEPEFVMPQVFLTWFYTGEKRDSLLKHIAGIRGITDYEKNVFTVWDLIFKRDYSSALDLGLRTIKEYPQDYYFNMVVGYLAKSTFKPKLAIKALSQLQDPLGSDFGMVWHYFKVHNYFESLMMLGEYNKALAYLQSIPLEHYNLVIPNLLINVYVKLGKPGKDVVDLIEEIGKDKIKYLIQRFKLDEKKLYALYYTTAAYEFYLASNARDCNFFAGKAIVAFNSVPGKEAFRFDIMDALFLSGSLSTLKAGLKKELQGKTAKESLLVYLAQAEAALGNADEAFRIFSRFSGRELIEWRRHEYPYQSDYLKARIHALLGEKAQAIALLQSAVKKGQLNHEYDFGRDIFLRNLFDEPAFREIIKPVESRESL